MTDQELDKDARVVTRETEKIMEHIDAAVKRLREAGAPAHVIPSVLSSAAARLFGESLNIMAGDICGGDPEKNAVALARAAAKVLGTYERVAGFAVAAAREKWKRENKDAANATKH